MSKAELQDEAEASKLASKPIKGNNNKWAAGGNRFYDGWSSFKVSIEGRGITK
jgi:hypothetical protein